MKVITQSNDDMFTQKTDEGRIIKFCKTKNHD